MLSEAISSCANVLQRCDSFDDEQEDMLTQAGGAEYVSLLLRPFVTWNYLLFYFHTCLCVPKRSHAVACRYAAISQLTYRQVVGAAALVWVPSKEVAWLVMRLIAGHDCDADYRRVGISSKKSAAAAA
jgi:hypothetical protein